VPIGRRRYVHEITDPQYAGWVICPKCQGRMHTVERRGVHIEQCQGCRGIFLDRGELEQIAHAEQGFYGASAPYRDSPPPFGGRQHGGHHNDSPPPYGAPQHGGRYSDSPPPYGHHGHKRRKGFFDELFG
jgi:Zn-finger nucleic acid-binding protein